MKSLHKIGAEEEIWLTINQERIPVSQLTDDHIKHIMNLYRNQTVSFERAQMLGAVYREGIRRGLRIHYMVYVSSYSTLTTNTTNTTIYI